VSQTILVVGSINTDLVTVTARMPGAGETMFADSFMVLPGGKGANQAVAIARLGGQVEMVGRVGDDAFGGESLSSLRDAGVAVDHVRVTEGVSSGVATIVVDASGENRILVVSGANACVSPGDVGDALLAQAALVVLQLEIPIETVYDVIARSPAPVLLNPAPAVVLDPARLRGLAFLVPNQNELSLLTGLPTARMDDVVVAARRLVRHGIGTVIVTLGADGAMVVTQARVGHVEAPVVAVIDTTGAGDAFIGCFAQTYIQTGDIDSAVSRAVRYAADSVTRRGAQSSYADAASFAG
jgi:ribokinase